MPNRTFTRRTRRARPFRRALLTPLVATFVTGVSAVPAAATDCLLDYVSCVENASDLDNFGRRSIAGLKCYVDLISCFQRRVA